MTALITLDPEVFTVLPVYWEPGGIELTPTMKLKRVSRPDKALYL